MDLEFQTHICCDHEDCLRKVAATATLEVGKDSNLRLLKLTGMEPGWTMWATRPGFLVIAGKPDEPARPTWLVFCPDHVDEKMSAVEKEATGG